MRIRANALLLLCAALTLPASAAAVPDDIRNALQSPQSLTAFIGEPLYSPAVLAKIYAARGDNPGWVSAAGPDAQVQQLLDAIRRSRDDGLQPADYHLNALNNLLDALHAPESFGALRNRQLTALDLLSSDAFLLLGEHELSGRLATPDLEPRKSVKGHPERLTKALSEVFGGADPSALLSGMAPADPMYLAMRAELARYRKLTAEPAVIEIPAGPTLHPGEQGTAIAALIARLRTFGDLAPAAAATARVNAERLGLSDRARFLVASWDDALDAPFDLRLKLHRGERQVGEVAPRHLRRGLFGRSFLNRLRRDVCT